jgi:hypothetical protein
MAMKSTLLIGLIFSGVLMSQPAQALTAPFTFGARKKVAEVAQGDAAPHVRVLPCTGGRCPPSLLLPLGGGMAWFGYEGLMPIGIIDLNKGAVLRYLDFSRKETPTGEKLALELHGGFSRSVDGKIHVLMPTAAADGKLGRQFALECSEQGKVLEMLPLPGLSAQHLIGISKDDAGRLWVADDGTKVFSHEGKALFKVPASGILLRNGMFLSQGRKVRLYAGDGRDLGAVTGTALPSRAFWSAAGPCDIVTRQHVEAESLHLLLHEVHVLESESRTLRLVDYLVFPAPPSQVSEDSGDEGGGPQGFTAFAFDDEGNVLSHEDASGGSRFYEQRLLRGPDAWRQKLESLPDGELSESELGWYRAEYLARVGLLKDSSPFHALLRRCTWFEEAARQKRTVESLEEDAVWRRLRKLRPR